MIFDRNIHAISTDYNSNVYCGLEGGVLLKLDSNLIEIQRFNIPEFQSISIIDAWNPLRPFLYSKELQMYLFLERFNSRPIIYSGSDYTDQFIEFIVPAIENSIWVVESPIPQLKKVNFTNAEVLLEIPISRIYEINRVDFIRAYKSILILTSKDSGIYFFDQFGSLISKLDVSGIDNFTVSQNQIISLTEDGSVFKFELNAQKKEVLHGPPGFDRVILIGKRYLFIKENKIVIFEYR